MAVNMSCPEDNLTFYVILNAYHEQLEFELPVLENDAQQWRRWIDTSLDSPDDLVVPRCRLILNGNRSAVFFEYLRAPAWCALSLYCALVPGSGQSRERQAHPDHAVEKCDASEV